MLTFELISISIEAVCTLKVKSKVSERTANTLSANEGRVCRQMAVTPRDRRAVVIATE